jgi:hypothetical protein
MYLVAEHYTLVQQLMSVHLMHKMLLQIDTAATDKIHVQMCPLSMIDHLTGQYCTHDRLNDHARPSPLAVASSPVVGITFLTTIMCSSPLSTLGCRG